MGIFHVGERDDQGAALPSASKIRERSKWIALNRLGHQIMDRLDNVSELISPPARRYVAMNTIGIYDQSDVIASHACGVAEHKQRVEGMVQLRNAVDFAQHAAADVDTKDYRLISLLLKLANRELA